MRPRPLSIAPIAALAFALSACQQSSSWPFESTALPDTADLASRPALPAMKVRYNRLMRELRAALSPQLGATGWRTKQPTAPTALCQDFGADADTGTLTLPFTVYDRFVPEPGWDWVAATVRNTARPYGFDRSVRVVDRTDEHRLELFDHYGASLSIQNGPRLLSIGLITGCHLRALTPTRSIVRK